MNILTLNGGYDNKGAEAMLLTLCAHLRQRQPAVSLFHIPRRGDEWEEEQLALHQIKCISETSYERDLPKTDEELFEELKVFFPLGLPISEQLADANRLCVDAVCDIRGFASGDQWGEVKARERWWTMHRLKALGIPIVYMPQAWGPFKDRRIRRYTKAMLRGAPLVFARDKASMRFLKPLVPRGTLKMASDIAFQFRASPPETGARLLQCAGIGKSDRPVVGIVPNYQVYNRCKGHGPENPYVPLLSSVCEWLVGEANADCLVLPHTRYAWNGPSDLDIGKMVAEYGQFGERLGVLEGEWGAADLKAAIGHLDMLVGSRFHAIIAACSQRVPAVAIGWSHKYVDLMTDVGLGEYVCSTEDFGARGLALVHCAWDSRRDLVGALEDNVPRLEHSALEALNMAVDTIVDYRRKRPPKSRPRVLEPSKTGNVSEVVDAGLCVGCGQCVSVCAAQAASLEETGAGLLRAKLHTDLCNDCGVCLRVCPGHYLHPSLLPVGCDPFKGQILGAYICRASDESLLKEAQSGGVVSTLLRDMLDRGEIDGAVVTRMPEDGRFRTESFVATSEDEILDARGSKYCPAAPNAVSWGDNRKIAFVGVSCQVHGLRNAEKAERCQAPEIVLGLLCDRMFSPAILEHFVASTGVPRDCVAAVRCKSKQFNGWPGDIRIRRTSGDASMLPMQVWHEAKDAFTHPRCYLCFDKLNVLSDISLGDAHGLSNDTRGASLVIVRTEKGAEALKGAEKRGLLVVTPVSEDDPYEVSQAIEERRDRWTASTWLAGAMGMRVPDVPILPLWHPPRPLRLDKYRRPFKWSVKMSHLGSLAEVLKAAKGYWRGDAARTRFDPLTLRAWANRARRLRRYLKGVKTT